MVIVIGAGLAGLACAHTLTRAGEEVVILEARSRAGGRCVTDHSLGVPVDLGASWIHGHRHNPLMHWARRYGCFLRETDYDSFAFYDGSGKLSKEKSREGGAFYEWVEEWCERLCYRHPKSTPDLSVAAAMAQDLDRGKTRIDLNDMRIFDWTLYAKSLDEGIDLGKLTLRYYEDDEPFEGRDYLFEQGYEELINAIADDLDIRYEREVKSVDYSAKQCVVWTTHGERYEADRVVCTLPLGVLKSGKVGFMPELPDEKSTSIDGLGVGVLNKVAVRFKRAFWDDEEIFGKLSSPYRHAGWVLNLEPVVKAPVLVGFVAGVDPVMELKDEEILNLFLSDLEACFGDAVSRVDSWTVTRWHEDDYALGSYAYVPVGGAGFFYDAMARSVLDRLYFAGEATHRDHPGTAHGALMSGIRAAEQILRP